jgi:hypothetical protein
MPGRRDLLRCRAGAIGALSAAVAEVERLVLLGDVVELRHGPQAAALEAALPVLAELAGALPAGAEVVVVPGNHDHQLLRGWAERRAAGGTAPLRLETAVDVQPAEALAELGTAFAPATLHVRYPGVWLREDVYATHGHYADRHTTVPMLERLAAGAMARVVGEPGRGPTRIEDYEAVLAPVYAWIHEVAQVGGPGLGGSSHGASAGAWRMLAPDAPTAARHATRRRRLRRRALVAGFPALIAALNRAGLGPLHPGLSGPELRRAALRAMGEVLDRLDVRAEHVIFGHSHRAGPLQGDEVAEWRAPAGQRLVNCGSWVHEPAFLGARPQQSPYRGGFGVRLDDAGLPQLVNLLDG